MPTINRTQRPRGGLLGPDHVGMQSQPQVGVGVHPDECAVPMTFEKVSGASLPVGRDDLADHKFAALGRPQVIKPGDKTIEFGGQSIQGHSSLW